MLRLHPSPSRVARLRAETPACYVAFDVLAAGDRDVRPLPLADRRAILGELRTDGPAAIRVTPATEDEKVAASWLAQFRGGGLDGVVAKDPSSRYETGRRSRAWRKVKQERTADCVVGGFRLLETAAGPPGETARGVAFLGLYDAQGELHHVGVISSFPAAIRRQLAELLAPYVTSPARHPWQHGFALERGPMRRLKGAAGAWDPATMEHDWVPVRPEAVCEVAYGQIDPTGRWRHPARFLRWRPDRDAASCTVEQMEITPPPPLAEVLPP